MSVVYFYGLIMPPLCESNGLLGYVSVVYCMRLAVMVTGLLPRRAAMM